ncbi:hypothetical protein BDZ97DRAFT_490244 [Flammula alnicola]|nr:hypothetical protein BDZ97DRAFT_490244 [Flammula alnicola]
MASRRRDRLLDYSQRARGAKFLPRPVIHEQCYSCGLQLGRSFLCGTASCFSYIMQRKSQVQLKAVPKAFSRATTISNLSDNLPNVHYTMSSAPKSVKIGIAMYNPPRGGSYGPRDPDWALAIHPTSYDAHDVKVYYIKELPRHNADANWYFGRDVCALSSLGDLIGVLHIGDVPFIAPQWDGIYPNASLSDAYMNALGSMPALDVFIEYISCPKKAGPGISHDPSIWGMEREYVLQIVALLSTSNMCYGNLPLPYVSERNAKLEASVVALKALVKVADHVNVLTFVEKKRKGPWLPFPQEGSRLPDELRLYSR